MSLKQGKWHGLVIAAVSCRAFRMTGRQETGRDISQNTENYHSEVQMKSMVICYRGLLDSLLCLMLI